MNARKPGLTFRFWTRTIDVFSPGRGKHRIYSRLQELYATLRDKNDAIAMRDRTIQDLETERDYLRKELRQAQSKLQTHMEGIPQQRDQRPRWAATSPAWEDAATMPLRKLTHDVDTVPDTTETIPVGVVTMSTN